MFAGKARSLPYIGLTEKHKNYTKIRLGWKSLPWTNTLAYYENA
jgi:hypothetical protein